jgi:hypothetical protein
VAIIFGAALALVTLFMMVRIYGNIIGYISDLRIYIDLVILEYKK